MRDAWVREWEAENADRESGDASKSFRGNEVAEEKETSQRDVAVTLSMSLHFWIRPSSSRRMAAACSSIESNYTHTKRQFEMGGKLLCRSN